MTQMPALTTLALHKPAAYMIPTAIHAMTTFSAPAQTRAIMASARARQYLIVATKMQTAIMTMYAMEQKLVMRVHACPARH